MKGDNLDILDGWHGNFGNSELIRPTAVPVNPVTGTFDYEAARGTSLVDVASDDGKPHPISIVLNAPLEDNPLSPRHELVAIISWGGGGVASLAQVDFVNGQVFNFVSSYVRVDVVQWPIPFAALGTVSARASAFAAPGLSPRATRPQRTIGYDGVLAPAGTNAAFIPRFSKSFRMVAVPAASALRVYLANDPVGPNIIADYAVVAFPSGDLLIPNDTRPGTWLNVVNTGGANVTAWRAIFDLEF